MDGENQAFATVSRHNDIFCADFQNPHRDDRTTQQLQVFADENGRHVKTAGISYSGGGTGPMPHA